MTMVDSFEKIPVKIFATFKEGSLFAANEIAALIIEKQKKNEKCILGLATGNTPKALYAELIRLHKN
ncbi:MAG: glucosamine-6-phosphate deaminase, partial [Flavitalea sp.]